MSTYENGVGSPYTTFVTLRFTSLRADVGPGPHSIGLMRRSRVPKWNEGMQLWFCLCSGLPKVRYSLRSCSCGVERSQDERWAGVADEPMCGYFGMGGARAPLYYRRYVFLLLLSGVIHMFHLFVFINWQRIVWAPVSSLIYILLMCLMDGRKRPNVAEWSQYQGSYFMRSEVATVSHLQPYQM